MGFLDYVSSMQQLSVNVAYFVK